MVVGKKKTSKAKAPAKTSKKVTKIEPPRAAKSAFIHYGEATRDEIKAAHPDLSLGDVGRKLAKDWKALDEIAKKPFLEAALKDKERFDAEKAAYDATDEGKAALAKQAAYAEQEAAREEERARDERERAKKSRKPMPLPKKRPKYEDDEDYVDVEEAPRAKKPRMKAPAKKAPRASASAKKAPVRVRLIASRLHAIDATSRDAVRAALRDSCSTQATKPKKKIAKKKFVLKPFVAPAPRIKGCVVAEDGVVRDVATGQFRGQVAIAGTRPVERIYASSKFPKKLGAVLDMKDLKDLGDVAAYLRPGKKLRVGKDIFKQDKSLKPLAGEDGVEYLGWNVQNKRPGVENEWVFVAVEEVEK